MALWMGAENWAAEERTGDLRRNFEGAESRQIGQELQSNKKIKWGWIIKLVEDRMVSVYQGNYVTEAGQKILC